MEVIRGGDLRIALSYKARTAYGTALLAADLTGGKSYRPAAALLPEITRRLAREGNLPFSGHEFPLAVNEYEVQRDLSFSLNFDGADSFLVAWAAAFALQDISSSQEGTTGHYTHTIKPSDPLGAAGMQAKVTDVFFDSGGPDATRRKSILTALATTRFAVSGRLGQLVSLAIDFLGDGGEDTSTAVSPLPALAAEYLMTGQRVKLELGDKGGALTDFTDRLREWAFTCDQQVDAENGYIPDITAGKGKLRQQLRFVRRAFSFDFSLFANRANTDIRDRVLAQTQSAIKLTVDSGIVAGTGAKNHGFEISIPACRLHEAPYDFDDAGAFYKVSVPSNQIYKDASIADSPVKITVENVQASYLA